MGDTKLLPCPWCGEELTTARVSEGSTFRWRKVDGCCTDGPEIRHDTMADNQAAAEIDSTRRAIEAWNTRPALLARQEGEDARDAARYRWLRSDSADLGPLFSAGSGGSMEMHSGQELDAAIDAARSGGGG